jgi:hypothetical protein
MGSGQSVVLQGDFRCSMVFQVNIKRMTIGNVVGMEARRQFKKMSNVYKIARIQPLRNANYRLGTVVHACNSSHTCVCRRLALRKKHETLSEK